MAQKLYEEVEKMRESQEWSEHIAYRRVLDYIEHVHPHQQKELLDFLLGLTPGEDQDEFGVCAKCGSEFGECGANHCEHDTERLQDLLTA